MALELVTILKSIWSVGRSAVEYLWKWANPPKIGYRLTPPNLLEVVRPYAYRGKILETIGEPHHLWKNEASYRFADSLLQIRYSDEETIVSVTLVSLSMRWPHRFMVHPLRFKLGRDTFGKTSGSDPLVMGHDGSSKFSTYWKTEYFGFGGSYLHFSFALIEAATCPPVFWRGKPSIRDDNGVWILENPKKIRFNAVSISADEPEFFPFVWSSFQ